MRAQATLFDSGTALFSLAVQLCALLKKE